MTDRTLLVLLRGDGGFASPAPYELPQVAGKASGARERQGSGQCIEIGASAAVVVSGLWRGTNRAGMKARASRPTAHQ
ncbi:MAG: hypothetical protein JWP48_903 [Actinoallomurus sp.]|nr:hypothetical protein [Actinoallomurus sp.]